MSRKGRIALSILGLLLLLGGALFRASFTGSVGDHYRILASLKAPTPKDLLFGVELLRGSELIADLCTAAGLAVTLVAAGLACGSRAFTTASVLLALGGLAAVVFPASKLALAPGLDRNNGWSNDPWSAMGDADEVGVPVLSDRSECYVHDPIYATRYDAAGLEQWLPERLARSRAPRVKLYLVDACQGEWRDAFTAAAKRACARTGTPLLIARLPDESEVRREWHEKAYALSAGLRVQAVVAALARLASAGGAFLLLLGFASDRVKPPRLLVFGLAVLGLAELAANPWLLWQAVAPSSAGSPTFKEVHEHLDDFVTLGRLSALGLAAGGVACVAALVRTRDGLPRGSEPPEEPGRKGRYGRQLG